MRAAVRLVALGRKTPLLRALAAVKGMFANNEVGAWYDPSDFTTMFQDSAGTTPVTAADQPVGLILDKSKGLVRGVELVTNGDFSNGATGWITTASMTASGGALVCTATPSGDQSFQSAAIATGKTYEITFQIIACATGGVRASLGSTFGTVYSAPGVYTSRLVATSGTVTGVQCIGVTTATIDNISVREIPGNHASQATSTKRPILKLSGGKYSLLFDGIDDALATASIGFTATDKMTVVAGVRKLSDAATGMVLEASINSNSNNGAFDMLAPPSTAGGFGGRSRGSLSSDPSSTAIAAPATAVVSLLASIATDQAVLRVNGTQAASAITDQGTGNYGNYPLYIGSRAGTSLPFNGHLYGLVIRASASTDAQITSAETYMNSKTGAF